MVTIDTDKTKVRLHQPQLTLTIS